MNESRIVKETSLKDILEIGTTRDMQEVRVSIRQHEDYTLTGDAEILIPQLKWVKLVLHTLDTLGYSVKGFDAKANCDASKVDEASEYQPVTQTEGC